jgi:hypothetical protein
MGIFRMKPEYNLAAVPANLVAIIWPTLEPILDRVIAVSNRELTSAGIKRRAISGETLIVAVCRNDVVVAVNVLDVVQFDSGLRAMYIPITGGDFMDEWLEDSLVVAKAIAKDLNCTELRGLASRNGWLRRLKKEGWESITTIIKCDVE